MRNKNPQSTMAKKLFVKDITHLSSDGQNTKQWESLPEIAVARPKGRYVEIGLFRLNTPKSVVLVQWMGARGGKWWPEGPVFMITKSEYL